MSFLDLAGADESTESRPAKRKTFLSLAGGAPKEAKEPARPDVPGGPLLAQSTATQDAIRADVAKTGAQSFTVNGQPPEATSVPVAAAPIAAPAPMVTGAAAIPGYQAPAPAAPPVPWWQKARAMAEAGANTVAGAVGGGVGMVYGGLEALGENATRKLAGEEPKMDVERQALFRGRQFTPELPKSMQTPLGQEYTENVGNALATHGPSVIGIGPEIAAVGTILRQGAPAVAARAGIAADRSMSAAKDAFETKKTSIEPSARVEPTAEPAPKPRYKLVNGEAQLVEQPPAGAPKPYVPSVKDASPEFQATVAKIKDVDPAVMSRHLEAETLPVPIRLTKGQATQDPTQLSNEQNMRGKQKALADHFNEQGKLLGQNVDAIRDSAAPDVRGTNHVENGQALVDSYKAMDEAARASVSEKYKALADANGGDLPLNGSDFVASADAALKKANRTRFVPPEVQGILGDLREGGPMTFGDFEAYRTILAEQARKADRAGDGTAAHAIGLIRESLESMPMSGDAAGLKPLADAARSAAKERFDRIKADPAYKAATNDATPIGEQSPAADKFVNDFVVKGKVANVAKMREHLAGDPVAQQTMAAGVINYLKNKAGADPTTGAFSQAGYNRALAEIAPKLDQLFDPKTAQQIQALGNVAKYTQAQPRGSFVNNSNTFVAGAAEAAKSGLEGAANVAAKGIPVGTWTRRAMASRAERKAVDDVLRPGAGVTRVSDFPK